MHNLCKSNGIVIRFLIKFRLIIHHTFIYRQPIWSMTHVDNIVTLRFLRVYCFNILTSYMFSY